MSFFSSLQPVGTVAFDFQVLATESPILPQQTEIVHQPIDSSCSFDIHTAVEQKTQAGGRPSATRLAASLPFAPMALIEHPYPSREVQTHLSTLVTGSLLIVYAGYCLVQFLEALYNRPNALVRRYHKKRAGVREPDEVIESVRKSSPSSRLVKAKEFLHFLGSGYHSEFLAYKFSVLSRYLDPSDMPLLADKVAMHMNNDKILVREHAISALAGIVSQMPQEQQVTYRNKIEAHAQIRPDDAWMTNQALRLMTNGTL